MLSSTKKISLFLILMVAFIDWMSVGLVYPMFSSMLFHKEFPILPYDTTDTVRGAYLGVLLAALSLFQFISSPILGTFSDKKGRKKILIYSLAIGVIGYFLAFVAVKMHSISLLIISRMVIGICAGSAAVVGAAIADLSSPDEKAKNYGLYNMACGVGFTVGPFLGGVLSKFGYATPFVFAGTVVLLNLLLVILFFKETHFLLMEGKVNFAVGFKNIKKAFYLPSMRVIFLAVFFFTFGWSFYYEFIPVTWINQYDMKASGVGTLYAYAAGFYALSCGLLIRPVVSRFNATPILFWGLLLSGSYILVMLAQFNLLFLWFYLPLQQYLIALLFPTATAMISNRTEKSMQGEVLGVFQSVQSAAFVISPLVAGPLLGLTDKVPIFVGGISMLVAGAIVGIFLRKEIFNS